jgi:malonyl-CoA/methylmalonyl-CoA synthetase
MTHTDKDISYVLEDAQIEHLLVEKQYAERMHHIISSVNRHSHLHIVDDHSPTLKEDNKNTTNELVSKISSLLDTIPQDDNCLIIYTSGTSGKPKGVVHTHKSINKQIEVLAQAWEMNQHDVLLHTLPLHHIHGLVNGLLLSLATGTVVEFLPKFSPTSVWKRLLNAQSKEKPPITLFFGVPTMYSHLLSSLKNDNIDINRQLLSNVRLWVSGSSSCPTPLFNAWEEATGQRLLERYGMTECGMALGNPLHIYKGPRLAGTVGLPFEGGLEVCLGDDGQIKLRGDQLFKEYWKNVQATKDAYKDGWFLTGDIAVLVGSNNTAAAAAAATTHAQLVPYYKILGRMSMDIIKVGGYKVSALEIESKLLEIDDISEVSVVAVDDDVYGEVPVCVYVAPTIVVDPLQLQEWSKKNLPKYQVPKSFIKLDILPRNAMGKVNKKQLKQHVIHLLAEKSNV